MPNFFSGYNPPQQFLPYPNAPPPNSSVMVVTVQDEAGARVYPVAAGNTVLLIDFDAKKFWLKSTDTNGMPSRFATFNFTEEVKQASDNGQFISRNEFDAWTKDINAQLTHLTDLLTGGSSNATTTSAKSVAVSKAVQ